MGDHIRIDDSDAFLIGFGAHAIAWLNDTFPLNRDFLFDFLELYKNMINKYLYAPALFTPKEVDFVNEAANALRKAFREHPTLPDVHDLGNLNNLEFFKNNHSVKECRLWVIPELPKFVIDYTSELSCQMTNIGELLVDNHYYKLGRIISGFNTWHITYQSKIKEIMETMKRIGVGNEILQAKYERELTVLFEEVLPNAEKMFEIENTLCGAQYSPGITKIPCDNASNGIFAAIYKENERELSTNIDIIRDAIKIQLGVELPSDKNLCLSYLTMHYTFILTLGIRSLEFQPFHFSRHYFFQIAWKLFTLVNGYIQQAKEPQSFIDLQCDAKVTVKSKNVRAAKKMNPGVIYGTVSYETRSVLDESTLKFPVALNNVEIMLRGESKKYQFKMFDSHSDMSKAAEQLLIIAASNGGVFTNEDMYFVMREFDLKFTKDMTNKIRNRINYSILKSIGEKSRKKVFYPDRRATKKKGMVLVRYTDSGKSCTEDRQIANTVFVTNLKFESRWDAPDEVTEYEREPNYDHRDMR